jgi:DNA-directed RNA polymerase subunit RPC12/RpoP
MVRICRTCGNGLVKTKMPYYYGKEKIGEFDAEECPNCGEAEFTDAAKAQIAAKARNQGVVTIGSCSMRRIFKGETPD